MAEVPEPVLPTPIEDDPERGTLLRGQQDEVRLANARLQPRQRLVLALRELEDRSYAEIGELVDMKENAVAQLIFRARESLRLELRLAQVDPERLPEECRRYLPLLAAHLDGQLKGARQQETLAHLESCERCQDALASMQEASKRYRTLFLPGFLETDEARAAVERRLDAAHYWDRPGGRLLVGRTKRSIAAVAAVIALSGGGTALGVALTRDGDPSPAAAAQATEAEVVVTTSEEIVAPLTEPTTTVARKRRATKPPPPGVIAPSTTTKPTTAPATTARATVETTPAPTTTTPKPRPTPAPKPKRKPTVTAPLPDTEAPTVTITQAPGASVSANGAQIRFTSNEAGAKFACKLDAAGLFRLHNARCFLRARRRRPSLLGPRHGQGRERGQAGERPVAVCPAGHDLPHRDAHLDPTRLHDGDECELRVHGERAGRRLRVLARRRHIRRLLEPRRRTSHSESARTPFAVRGRDAAGNVGQPASFGWSIVAPPPPPPPPRPDLYVASFTKNTIVIRNGGNAAAGSTSILTISVVNLQFTVPNLAAGASVTFNWGACAIGTYVATVDRTNLVAESNETNNTASRPNSSCP